MADDEFSFQIIFLNVFAGLFVYCTHTSLRCRCSVEYKAIALELHSLESTHTLYPGFQLYANIVSSDIRSGHWLTVHRAEAGFFSIAQWQIQATWGWEIDFLKMLPKCNMAVTRSDELIFFFRFCGVLPFAF